MTGRRGAWRTWGAILAAYLLVVQAAFAGMLLGAQAAPLRQADALNVLCSDRGAADDAGQAPAKHHGLPNCCVAGCAMLGGGLAPGPSNDPVLHRPVIETTDSARPAFEAPTRTPERTSTTSRAPPATA